MNTYNEIFIIIDSYLSDTQYSLNDHFESSILSIDYNTFDEFWRNNGCQKISPSSPLQLQFLNSNIENIIKGLLNILTIFNSSNILKEENNEVYLKIKKLLDKSPYMLFIDSSNNIKITNVIGSGSYCTITKIDNSTLKKELNSEFFNTDMTKRLKYEFENMIKLKDCPNILKVFEFNKNDYTYTMEKCECSLYDYMKKNTLTKEEKFKIIKDVVTGMAYAHSKEILHRDLHLGNILKKENNFVICDFGLSKDLSVTRSLKSSCTTKNNHKFVDPYVENDFTKYDYKCDLYSLGHIILHIISSSDSANLNYIIDKCTSPDRNSRYNTAENLLTDLNTMLEDRINEQNRQKAITDISNCNYNLIVNKFILDKMSSDTLCTFIVNNHLSSFGTLILLFNNANQIKILQYLISNYSSATRYNTWSDYDIFADIFYYIAAKSSDITMRKLAKSALEDIANGRYYAANLLAELD